MLITEIVWVKIVFDKKICGNGADYLLNIYVRIVKVTYHYEKKSSKLVWFGFNLWEINVLPTWGLW